MKLLIAICFLISLSPIARADSAPSPEINSLGEVAKTMQKMLLDCSSQGDVNLRSQCLFGILDWMGRNPDSHKINSKYPAFSNAVYVGLNGANYFCKQGNYLENGSGSGEQECLAFMRVAVVQYLIATLQRTGSDTLPFDPKKYLGIQTPKNSCE